MKGQKLSRNGYTLIELLVSISITIILLGLGFAAFRSFGAASELDSGADRIRSTLFEMRNFAFAPESIKPLSVTHYGVQFNIDENSLTLVRIKDDKCEVAAIDSVIEKFTLNPILKINSAPTLVCTKISPEAETSVVGENLIEVEHRRTTNVKSLIINQLTGQIDIQNE